MNAFAQTPIEAERLCPMEPFALPIEHVRPGKRCIRPMSGQEIGRVLWFLTELDGAVLLIDELPSIIMSGLASNCQHSRGVVMGENLLGFTTAMTLGLCFALLFLLARTQMAVARIEGRLNALLKHSGIDANAMALEQATSLMRDGKKIEAIKALRDMTGCGLAEAKQKVESLL
jgi:hypothetical protein